MTAPAELLPLTERVAALEERLRIVEGLSLDELTLLNRVVRELRRENIVRVQGLPNYVRDSGTGALIKQQDLDNNTD